MPAVCVSNLSARELIAAAFAFEFPPAVGFVVPKSEKAEMVLSHGPFRGLRTWLLNNFPEHFTLSGYIPWEDRRPPVLGANPDPDTLVWLAEQKAANV